MLRYPQPLGCMRGGEGLSDMRSLLLRETVINESRNCSFMVRRGRGGGGWGTTLWFHFGYWISCLRQVSFLWGKIALKICFAQGLAGWCWRDCIENLMLYKCHNCDAVVSPLPWKINGTIGNMRIRLTFPTIGFCLCLYREASEDVWAFVLVFLGKTACVGCFLRKWSVCRVPGFIDG